MDTPLHKTLDFLDHIWPYLIGFITMLFTTIAATARLWWHDRKEREARVARLEVLYEHLKSNSIDHETLHECREDVREEDEKNLNNDLGEIKLLRSEIRVDAKENAKQHDSIMDKIIDKLG